MVCKLARTSMTAVYQFNNIGFIDDILILAETPEGMQTLLDMVQEFTVWCGMEINVIKNFLAHN